MATQDLESRIRSLNEQVDRLQREADWRRKNAKTVRLGCVIMGLLMIAAAIGCMIVNSVFPSHDHSLQMFGVILLLISGPYVQLGSSLAASPTEG